MCPENTNQSGPNARTSTGMWETDCAPSSNTFAPTECAAAMIWAAGVMVPNALETCANETSFVFGPSTVFLQKNLPDRPEG